MPVTSLLSPTRTLEAQKWDTVSMDRGVFILFSMGADWSINGSWCGRGCVGRLYCTLAFEVSWDFCRRRCQRCQPAVPKRWRNCSRTCRRTCGLCLWSARRNSLQSKRLAIWIRYLNHEVDFESPSLHLCPFPISHRGLCSVVGRGCWGVLSLCCWKQSWALMATNCCNTKRCCRAGGALSEEIMKLYCNVGVS